MFQTYMFWTEFQSWHESKIDIIVIIPYDVSSMQSWNWTADNRSEVWEPQCGSRGVCWQPGPADHPEHLRQCTRGILIRRTQGALSTISTVWMQSTNVECILLNYFPKKEISFESYSRPVQQIVEGKDNSEQLIITPSGLRPLLANKEAAFTHGT